MTEPATAKPATDLAAWLTQIFDERQKAAERWAEHIETWGTCSPDAPDLLEEFARIAADRQILARLQALEAQRREQIRDYQQWVDGSESRRSQWEYDSQEMKEIEGLRYVVRLLAQLYADRPGYQEAWKS